MAKKLPASGRRALARHFLTKRAPRSASCQPRHPFINENSPITGAVRELSLMSVMEAAGIEPARSRTGLSIYKHSATVFARGRVHALRRPAILQCRASGDCFPSAPSLLRSACRITGPSDGACWIPKLLRPARCEVHSRRLHHTH